ncbi:hypothetical protein ACFFNY_31855 [Paenibacillus hodogayensis]|uniref:Uncharacterized protein n=1 Tax=Paenibacillus hodogayensis TaxID=279208 RepID=A0ABV5W6L0_9BACL
MSKIKWSIGGALLALALATSGCGGKEAASPEAAGQPEPAKQEEPVTLKFYTQTAMTADDFEQYVNRFVKRNFRM